MMRPDLQTASGNRWFLVSQDPAMTRVKLTISDVDGFERRMKAQRKAFSS
jgi:hypothetical protein